MKRPKPTTITLTNEQKLLMEKYFDYNKDHGPGVVFGQIHNDAMVVGVLGRLNAEIVCKMSRIVTSAEEQMRHYV